MLSTSSCMMWVKVRKLPSEASREGENADPQPLDPLSLPQELTHAA